MATVTMASLRPWLDSCCAQCGDTIIYGFADLEEVLPEPLCAMPRGISYAVRMNDPLMDSVRNGPHDAYFAEYTRVNQLLNNIGDAIAEKIQASGYAAERIHSSQTVDPANFAGVFQHKTAAVIAGYGWIGRNCQLITRLFGPRVRLGTVITDMDLGEEPAPRMRSYCGSCSRCVDACPSQSLTGNAWREGGARSDVFDAARCSAWAREHYPRVHAICGICTSVCPQGTARRKKAASAASEG